MMAITLSQKVVRTKKTHQCFVCHEPIIKGIDAWMYNCVGDEGRIRLYAHDGLCMTYWGLLDESDREEHTPLSRQEIKEWLHGDSSFNE